MQCKLHAALTATGFYLSLFRVVVRLPQRKRLVLGLDWIGLELPTADCWGVPENKELFYFLKTGHKGDSQAGSSEYSRVQHTAVLLCHAQQLARSGHDLEYKIAHTSMVCS